MQLNVPHARASLQGANMFTALSGVSVKWYPNYVCEISIQNLWKPEKIMWMHTVQRFIWQLNHLFMFHVFLHCTFSNSGNCNTFQHWECEVYCLQRVVLQRFSCIFCVKMCIHYILCTCIPFLSFTLLTTYTYTTCTWKSYLGPRH